MVQRTEEKVSVLVLTVLFVALSLFPNVRETLGLYAGCPWYGRLGYPFAHANILHAMVNSWCLLSFAFAYDISWKQLLAAYIIAISFPNSLLDAIPVVGASGVCFALIGIVALRSKRRVFFQFWVLSILAVGFLFPSCAAWLHVYCYLLGLLIGMLSTPLSILKGGQHGGN